MTEQKIRTIGELLEGVSKRLEFCKTSGESYELILDLIIEGYFNNSENAESIRACKELKEWINKSDINFVTMLVYFSTLSAFHPYYLKELVTCPSMQAVQAYKMNQVLRHMSDEIKEDENPFKKEKLN